MPLFAAALESGHQHLHVMEFLYAFELPNGGTFAFAGLWDAWTDKEGHWLQSFAIVTTEANELMRRIHPRMPVILHSRDYDRWLDREETERLPVDLLRSYESEDMEMYEANPEVDSVWNNGPEMMQAAAKPRRMGNCRSKPPPVGAELPRDPGLGGSAPFASPGPCRCPASSRDCRWQAGWNDANRELGRFDEAFAPAQSALPFFGTGGEARRRDLPFDPALSEEWKRGWIEADVSMGMHEADR